jgi:hypothetical protein
VARALSHGPGQARLSCTARIDAVPKERAGWLGRPAYRYSRRRFGAVPDPVAIYAHHPGVLGAYSALELLVR